MYRKSKKNCIVYKTTPNAGRMPWVTIAIVIECIRGRVACISEGECLVQVEINNGHYKTRKFGSCLRMGVPALTHDGVE